MIPIMDEVLLLLLLERKQHTNKTMYSGKIFNTYLLNVFVNIDDPLIPGACAILYMYDHLFNIKHENIKQLLILKHNS